MMKRSFIVPILSLLLTFCVGCHNNNMYKPSIVNEPSVDSFSIPVYTYIAKPEYTYIGKKCPINTKKSKFIKKCVLLHDTLIVIVDKDGLFNNKIIVVENVDPLYKRYYQRYECINDTIDTMALHRYFVATNSLDSIIYFGEYSRSDYILSGLSIKDSHSIYEGIFVGMTKKELFSLFDYHSFPITNYNMVCFISSYGINGFVSLYPPISGPGLLIVRFEGNRISQLQLGWFFDYRWFI